MFAFNKRTLPIAITKELEYLRAQAEIANQTAADTAFIAMCAGVDLTVGEDNTNEQAL